MAAIKVPISILGGNLALWFSPLLMVILISCRSADVDLGARSPASSKIEIQYLSDSLGGDMSSIASSVDGRLYVMEPGSWRIKIFSGGRDHTSEIDLEPGRYLMAGGALQGMVIYDLTKGLLKRYDQQGREVIRASMKDRSVSALWLAFSGEYLFLDGIAGRVMLYNEGLREIRSWNLKGPGRPQAIAGSPLDGLVAVAYPDEGRIDTYSLFGMLKEIKPFPVNSGAQTIAFDQSGRLWALGDGDSIVVFEFSKRGWQQRSGCRLPRVRALSMAPRKGIIALSRGRIVQLSLSGCR